MKRDDIRSLRSEVRRVNEKLWSLYDSMVADGESLESLNIEFLSKAISALGTLHYSLMCQEHEF